MATITSVKERINQLNPASFQILCDELLSKEGYPNIVSLGTQDGAEKTTRGTPDTFFCLSNGKYVFTEYTTQKTGLPAKIRADIDKCLDENYTKVPLQEIAEIVYCHTSSNISPADDRTLRLLCEENGIKLTLIGIDSLAEKLMKYPSIIKRNLMLSIDSEQIQTADDFIRQYDSNAMAATLATDFLFRETEIDSIDKAFDKVSAVLLTGPAGTGKTRLAVEYAKRHASKHNETLLCIHDRSIPMYEDLKLYFEKPGDYFVFVDDANQLSELEHVIEYANKTDAGYRVRILMTVRDYAVSKVKSDISGIIRYETIPVTPFSDGEITELVKNNYGIQNPNYLERIVQIAEGNARIAMLAGKIACDANRLDAISDVSALYVNYFGRVLHETGIDSNNKLLVSAGIMAFLNAIHLDHIDPILPILDMKGLAKSDFIENLHILHGHEIVDIYNDKGVRFSEQCMANFVLKYVFFDRKVISLSAMIESCFAPYHQRTIHAVNTLLAVYHNADLKYYVEEEILNLWKKLETEDSPIFFDYLKTFFPANEVQTLLILKKRIDAESPIFIRAEDINTEDGKNFQSVSDDIINILGGFAYLENLDSALDLFFQYYLKRPDLYMQFYHAATSSFSVDKHSSEYGFRIQILFFTKMLEYCKNDKDNLVELLFIGVASHFLQLEFSPCEDTRNGKGVTLYYIPIELTPGVKEYRELIWKHLMSVASTSSWHQRIKNLLRTYGKTVYDCSKEVVKFDASYIFELLKQVLSPENLADCLTAQSLQGILAAAEYPTDELRPFLDSPKYKLYQLIIGPKWTTETSFEERRNEKKAAVQKYLFSSEDKFSTFKELFQMFIDSASEDNHIVYETGEGINIAMQSLVGSGADYIHCASLILSSETITGIAICQIVEPLFSMLTSQEVFELLGKSNQHHRNEWFFAYYHEIPQNNINQKELAGLYAFLKDNSDRDIHLSSGRDIDFLDKYLSADPHVIIAASEIILKKKEYSPFMVCLYFEYQFNEFHIHPSAVIQKFSQDINLLEQIYLCVKENGRLADLSGKFLSTLLEADKGFIKKYIKWFIRKSEKAMLAESDPDVAAFYSQDEYLYILDSIVDKAISSVPFPSMIVPEIIKRLLVFSDESKERLKKCDCWIKHFIESYYNDAQKMCFLFEALTEISIAQAAEYIALLINCTKNYDIFEAIPLTPSSYTWSGSLVPMYSSWVENLEKLLPLFAGLDYIKHKNRVQQLIECYRKRIKEEEISDILEG
ncbi:MAG: ATP-binding protein [Candidatus Faecousia sp.]|nr:ATP-binding protein [Candidatus Faecousia sp.]